MRQIIKRVVQRIVRFQVRRVYAAHKELRWHLIKRRAAPQIHSSLEHLGSVVQPEPLFQLHQGRVYAHPILYIIIYSMIVGALQDLLNRKTDFHVFHCRARGEPSFNYKRFSASLAISKASF